MELAGRVFDVITKPSNLTDEVRELLPDLGNPNALPYYRCVLRMAALCHDIGHLPFSHAAEDLVANREGIEHVVQRAERLVELKPHISSTDALSASEQVDRLIRKSRPLRIQDESIAS